MTDFTIHAVEEATPGARQGLSKAKEQFGFVPNLLGIMAEAPSVLDAYLMLAERFASSSLSPLEQQVVLVTAAVHNRCDYCVAAHSWGAQAAGADAATLASLRAAQPVQDARLAALQLFTRAVVDKRGFATKEDVDAFRAAGFSRANVLEVVLGVTQKTLSNYVNHMAETPLDPQLAGFKWEPNGVL